MAARAALILSGAGCVLPSVSSGVAVLAGTLRLKYICPRGSIAAFAFGSRLPSRFYRRVCLWFTPALAVLSPRLPLVHACPRGSIAAFAFGSRLSFFLCQEKRDGLRCLAFLFRGSRSPSCVLAVSVRLSAFVGSLRVCAFLYGDLDGLPGCGGRGYGVGGAAFVRFCASALALESFRGEYAGAARPKPAPKSLRLSGLSSLGSR